MCPPEGDAGTGMTATNSVKQRTGNISAGTSVFAMAVLEKDLSKAYDELVWLQLRKEVWWLWFTAITVLLISMHG